MISLTRREFDTVSTALTDVWLEARRHDRLERLSLVRQDKPQTKSKKQPDARRIETKPIPH